MEAALLVAILLVGVLSGMAASRTPKGRAARRAGSLVLLGLVVALVAMVGAEAGRESSTGTVGVAVVSLLYAAAGAAASVALATLAGGFRHRP